MGSMRSSSSATMKSVAARSWPSSSPGSPASPPGADRQPRPRAVRPGRSADSHGSESHYGRGRHDGFGIRNRRIKRNGTDFRGRSESDDLPGETEPIESDQAREPSAGPNTTNSVSSDVMLWNRCG